MGAPYGQYLLADAAAGRVPAKLQVFLSAWALSPGQRRDLAAGRPAATTRVWCWAPGFIYPDRQDTAGVGQATPVFDALDGRPLGQGPRLSVSFKQGETRVLRY